jgi:hypothetical protein
MKFLPDNVIYLINCYAGIKMPNHILEDIQYNHIDEKLDKFNEIYEDFLLYRYYVDEFFSFSEYLTITIDKDNRQEYLYHFSNCNCCLRHSVCGKIRTKKKICYKKITLNNKICTCKCRHFRRFIERSFI